MTIADEPSIFYKESFKGFRQLDHELDGKGNAAATGALGSSGRLILRKSIPVCWYVLGDGFANPGRSQDHLWC